MEGSLSAHARRDGAASSALFVEAGADLCAIPITYVVETMRALPITPIAGAPAFVLGLSIIRGAPAVVVALASFLQETQETSSGGGSGRLVILRDGDRRIAVAVDRVLGVRDLEGVQLESLPTLLQAADRFEGIGAADARLVLVLRSSRIVAEDRWATPASRGPA